MPNPIKDKNRKLNKWTIDFWHLAKPYWQSEEKYQALGLFILTIFFNLAFVATSIAFNIWQKTFYNTLQNYEINKFIFAVKLFIFYIFLFTLFQGLAFYFQKILETRWRKWLLSHYISNWFKEKSYYKINFLNIKVDNTYQEINFNINNYVYQSLNLFFGFISSVATFISFTIILWQISGVLTINLPPIHIVLHGYLVLGCLTYTIIGTFIAFKIGRPLIQLNNMQQQYDSNFKYNLIRIKEYSESIALYHGEHSEKTNLMIFINSILNNFMAIMIRQIKITAFNNPYYQIGFIIAVILAAPEFFLKLITLGVLMQIVSAFGNVQKALSYFIYVFSSIAGWRATMNRLYKFEQAIKNSSKLNPIPIKLGTNILKLVNLNLYLPNWNLLAQDINLTLNSSDRLLIKGQSGIGKTTLLRTIAGLWHYAKGNIYQSPNIKSLFISQKPYLPITTLKHAICYPLNDSRLGCD